jgi:hypothetical protein
VFCVHRFALSALKFLLPCFPEVQADPNIVGKPGHEGVGRLVPHVELSADWYYLRESLALPNAAPADGDRAKRYLCVVENPNAIALRHA